MTPMAPEQRSDLARELERVAKFIQHAQTHNERGNIAAVVEAIADARRRLERIEL